MENRPVNDELWVENRLRTLDNAADWHPNASVAFARLRNRDRRRGWRLRWIWSMAMASAGTVSVIALPAPAKCALIGVGCPRTPSIPVLLAPAAVAPKSA